MNNDGRSFCNPFTDYRGEAIVQDGKKLKSDLPIVTKIRESVHRLLQRLYSGLEECDEDDNFAVYTGTCGIGLLNLHLYETIGNKDQSYLENALKWIKRSLKHLKGKRISFVCGDPGQLAIGAIVYNKLGQISESKNCIRKLQSLHSQVISDPTVPDEILYGRAGYLYSLLFVRKYLDHDAVDNTIIVKVAKAILESGQALSQEEKWPHPLMYKWHNSHYLGAAHGISGIYYMLLQVDDPEVTEEIKKLVLPCLDYALSLRYPSGNMPSSIGSSVDKLVHWCHGAPGWIHLYACAYEIYKDERFLVAMKKAADVVWERGLLQKGYGLCHGSAGNGYASIIAWKVTGDQKYIYRALKFAEWCCDYGRHGCRTPDTPFSLFEGMAGTIYFLADVLEPFNAKFPAFEL